MHAIGEEGVLGVGTQVRQGSTATVRTRSSSVVGRLVDARRSVPPANIQPAATTPHRASAAIPPIKAFRQVKIP